jgi:hypothetical protein
MKKNEFTKLLEKRGTEQSRIEVEAAPTSEAICITCLSDPAKSRGIEYLPTLLETVTWEIGQTGDDRRGLAFATATRYHVWLDQWRKTQGYGPLSAPPWVDA